MYLRGEGSLAGCRRLLWAGDRHDREGKRRLPRCDEGRDLATEKNKNRTEKECGATIDILEVKYGVLLETASFFPPHTYFGSWQTPGLGNKI